MNVEEKKNTDNKQKITHTEIKMNRKETNRKSTSTSTSTKTTTNSTTSKQIHLNVIESLKEYNQLQTNKISYIDNDTTALDDDVVHEATHGCDMAQMSEPTTISKTVVCIFHLYYHNVCVCYWI